MDAPSLIRYNKSHKEFPNNIKELTLTLENLKTGPEARVTLPPPKRADGHPIVINCPLVSLHLHL